MKVCYFTGKCQNVNFANGGSTVWAAILYGPSHILSIFLLSWIYDTSGYFEVQNSIL